MLRELWRATRLYGQEREEKNCGRSIKFFTRALLQWPHSVRWFRFLRAQPELAAVLGQQPQWLHKLQRPYLCSGYGAETKLQLLRTHFGVFLTRLPRALRSRLLAEKSVCMARFRGKGGDVYEIHLAVTQIMDKEGELMLTLQSEAVAGRLATLAFSFGLDQFRQPRIYIGCLQGHKADCGRDQFRAMTKDLHGLMPKRLLVKALCMVARLMGVESLLAISNQSHVHNAGWHHYHAIQADYDGLWNSLGGVPLNRDYFRLNPNRPERALSEVASNKRAEYGRRLMMESNIADQFGLNWLPAQLGDPRQLNDSVCVVEAARPIAASAGVFPAVEVATCG